MGKFCVLLAMTFLLASYPVGLRAEAAESAAGEYLVLGTVVSVHPSSAAIVIREASLFGRLRFQVKSYKVQQPSALLALRPGDRIMAVYSKKDGMLHRLRESRSSKDRAASNKTPL
jgi:hypothetical protein